MDLNKRSENHWGIITILLFILAGVVFLFSIPSYQTTIHYLSKSQADGSFDSLSLQAFNILRWLIRGKSLILALAGLFCLFNKERSSRWIQKIGSMVSRISIRTDLKDIFQSTFPREDKWIVIAMVRGHPFRSVDPIDPDRSHRGL